MSYQVLRNEEHYLVGRSPVSFMTADNPEGATNEDVVQMLIHRIKSLQNSHPCDENLSVLSGLYFALESLDARQKRVTKDKKEDNAKLADPLAVDSSHISDAFKVQVLQ